MESKKESKELGFCLIVILLCIVEACFGAYFLVREARGHYNERVVSLAGVVSDKNTYSYSCGKHGRRTCTDYLINIGGKNQIVDSMTFHNTTVGQKTVLYSTISTMSEWKSFLIVGMIPCLVIAMVLCAYCATKEDL